MHRSPDDCIDLRFIDLMKPDCFLVIALSNAGRPPPDSVPAPVPGSCVSSPLSLLRSPALLVTTRSLPAPCRGRDNYLKFTACSALRPHPVSSSSSPRFLPFCVPDSSSLFTAFCFSRWLPLLSRRGTRAVHVHEHVLGPSCIWQTSLCASSKTNKRKRFV